MESGLRSVCFLGDFPSKTVDECMHRSARERGGIRRIFMHMQYFSYLLVFLLYMEIVLTLVCYRNLNNVHFGGNIFTKQPLNPSGTSVAPSIWDWRSCPTIKLPWWIPLGWSPNGGASKKQRCDSQFVKWHDINTSEECADEWMLNNADFNWLCHEWFHHARHHVHDDHSIGYLATIFWRLDSFIVSFRGVVRGESGLRKLASDNEADFKKNTPAWLNKMRGIKSLCVDFDGP